MTSISPVNWLKNSHCRHSHLPMNKIELLIPAKDLHNGRVAIDHGADALYIGAPKFGARQAVGNSIQDIEALVQYAHLYGSKVYVTVNTLLYDEELEEAQRLIYSLYNAGADALIIQDLGILKLDFPPIKLHASTQCHNHSVERIQFLEKLGFQRAILARETDLNTIKAMRANSNIEIETFIHGALCVSYSGQCYISKMLTGRSGNRGECAQICRTCFDLCDANGEVLIKNKHLLSLRDMNRSAFLKEIFEAGVISLKVEGRLKDENYVKNVTSYYRKSLDMILGEGQRLGSGKTTLFFNPDPDRTFNRGFTDYFLKGERSRMASFDTPKAMGKKIGRLRQDSSGKLFYDGDESVVNGDGLCFINQYGELEGFSVNHVAGNQIIPHKPLTSFRQVDLYRNVDKTFEKLLNGKTAERKIDVNILFEELENGFKLTIMDEDGCQGALRIESAKEPAKNPEMAMHQLESSLMKLGETPFVSSRVELETGSYFFPNSMINKWRNEAVENLKAARIEHFKAKACEHPYSPESLYEDASYKRNITNALHQEVYEDFGARNIECGVDKTLDFKDKEVMICKYCLRYELGQCKKQQRATAPEPWYLKNSQSKFRLEFNCNQCVMKIIAEK